MNENEKVRKKVHQKKKKQTLQPKSDQKNKYFGQFPYVRHSGPFLN